MKKNGSPIDHEVILVEEILTHEDPYVHPGAKEGDVVWFDIAFNGEEEAEEMVARRQECGVGVRAYRMTPCILVKKESNEEYDRKMDGFDHMGCSGQRWDD